MRSLLLRCYPARWRARYGDEFEAILVERPLGPFDVADILLGALDAQLRLRGHVADTQQMKGFSMSLRVGGFAAILGAALLATSIVLGIGVVGSVEPVVPGILLAIGSLALLVALAGLSAFQARVHPILSWAAVAVTAVGTIVVIGGIVGMQLFRDGYWDVMTIGVVATFVGSTLFAIATYRTAALSRRAALLLGSGSVLTIGAGFAGNSLGPAPLIATSIAFALGWFVLGIYAVRVDRRATA
ncbi:MAG: hypothetical protein ABIZ72_08660 [Candidatus Limnocylindrales bacterium]